MGTGDALLDQKSMCNVLGITTKTAEAWRTRGFGPRFVKVGSLVRYRKSDIHAWVNSRAVKSTSQKLPKSAA